ncbi:MAG: hypothetical protein Q7V40_09655, partial [Pseudolabrys sp.]|nr:hypothetical protein [Pseudolabrys sp.]
MDNTAPNFRAMTDEELRAWKPSPPAIPDFKNMTDAELKAWKPSNQVQVQPEAEQQPTGALGTASAASGNFIGGFPVVGPIIKGGAERAAASIRSMMHGSSYDDELKAVQGYAARTTEENPTTSTVAGIGGAVAGTVPMVMAAPAAFGAGAGNLATRSLASTFSGGVLGGADAAVRSGGDMDSIKMGAGIGAGLGFVGPSFAAGAGRGMAAATNWWRNGRAPGASVPGLNRGATNYAIKALGDPAKRAALRADIDKLGPEGMLADVSPEWMGFAGGAASRPGMRDQIVNPLVARDTAKNVRLRADLDKTLGSPVVPSQVDDALTASQRSLGQEYDAVFRNARAVDTTPLAHSLEGSAVNLRGSAQRATNEIRKMLNIRGTDVLDPNPGTLHEVRKAIDGMMATNVDPNTARVLAATRGQVDDILTRSVPGIKSVDAKFAELARQREALTRGQQVLDSGRTAPRPAEVAQEVSEGALPRGEMVGPSASPLRLRQGARAEIDRVVGTNANDPAAMQRLVKSEGDWNRDRLRSLFGKDRADDALNAIDRETAFYRTSGRVTAGSDTALRNRFGNFLDKTAEPPRIPTDTTITGASLRGAQKLGQALLGVNSEAKA